MGMMPAWRMTFWQDLWGDWGFAVAVSAAWVRVPVLHRYCFPTCLLCFGGVTFCWFFYLLETLSPRPAPRVQLNAVSDERLMFGPCIVFLQIRLKDCRDSCDVSPCTASTREDQAEKPLD